jgi:hypothetical protein
MNKIVKLAVAVIIAGFIAQSSKATLVTYNWVPDSANNLATSSGSLVYNTSSGLVTQFSWTDGAGTVDAFFLQSIVTVLTGGDLQLRGAGEPSSTYTFNQVQWVPFSPMGPDQNLAYDFSHPGYYWGNWVAHSASVPEPGTVLTGALLLLPLGAGALRRLRKA